MPLSAQFKRNVVGIFYTKRLKISDPKEKALAAVNIALENLVENGYLSRVSLRLPVEDMKETSKGRKRSRSMWNDKTHTAKLKKFDRIWRLYLEAKSEKKSE